MPNTCCQGPHFWDESVCPAQRRPAKTSGYDGSFAAYVTVFDRAAALIRQTPSRITGEASSNTYTGVLTYLRCVEEHGGKQGVGVGVTVLYDVRGWMTVGGSGRSAGVSPTATTPAYRNEWSHRVWPQPPSQPHPQPCPHPRPQPRLSPLDTHAPCGTQPPPTPVLELQTEPYVPPPRLSLLPACSGRIQNRRPPLNATLAHYLLEAAPFSRFVVLFRDPVKRYYSAYYYYRWGRGGQGSGSARGVYRS